MSRKRLIAVLMIILLVVFVVFIFYPADRSQKTYEVYMTKDSFTPGDSVDKKKITTKKVTQVEPWMIQDLKDIEGMKAKRVIDVGRYLDKGDFSTDTPVAFQEGEGEYTVKAKVEYINGGRAEVGDIVDVIFVKRQSGAQQQLDPITTGETVFRNVMVISVRNQYGKDIKDMNKKEDLSAVPASVTLKVTEQQSDKLAWCQENGTVSFRVIRKGELIK